MTARWLLLCLGLALHAPAQAELVSASPAEASAPVPGAAPVLNINAASIEELCTLPGIGRKKAEAIVALRTRRPLTRVTQLLQVKGIGPKTLHRLKPRLSVSQVPLAPK